MNLHVPQEDSKEWDDQQLVVKSIEDEEVSLVDGVLEGALGTLGFGNRGSSGGHGGLWWLMMNEEDGELVMWSFGGKFYGKRLFLK
ncbi:hypothetical protein Tco_1250424 [Tanacetum coccineum]